MYYMCFVFLTLFLLFSVFEILYQPVSDVAWLCVLGITAVLALIAVGLLAHLLGFHIYLSKYHNVVVFSMDQYVLSNLHKSYPS